jgi:hypothetical protein
LIGIRGDWKPASKLKSFAAWLLMFSLIVFGWTIFRAPSMAWLTHILFAMPFIPSHSELILAMITLTLTLAYSLPLLLKSLLDRYVNGSWWQAAFYAFAAALIVVYINSASSDFIYFQF